MTQAKFQKLKQKGFTLLELLVVITLLAILSVGALVAYEGVGDNAQATAAANNTAGADRAIRNFRAVTQNYPDQWDMLVTTTGATPAFLGESTQATIANLALPVTAAPGDFRDLVDTRLVNVGITELQARTIVAATAGVEPNLQHNEGAVGLVSAADVVEDDVANFTNFSILPTFGTAACTIGGVLLPTTTLDGTTAINADSGLRQNLINDYLGSDECHFILALGFGHDAAHSTNTSAVAISTAPTFVSKNINPATSYARYIALFHMGGDGENGGTEDGLVTADELYATPRLLAVVDTEGRAIDQNIAKQNPAN